MLSTTMPSVWQAICRVGVSKALRWRVWLPTTLGCKPARRTVARARLVGRGIAAFNVMRLLAYLPVIWAIHASGLSTQHASLAWLSWAGAFATLAACLWQRYGCRVVDAVAARWGIRRRAWPPVPSNRQRLFAARCSAAPHTPSSPDSPSRRAPRPHLAARSSLPSKWRRCWRGCRVPGCPGAPSH